MNHMKKLKKQWVPQVNISTVQWYVPMFLAFLKSQFQLMTQRSYLWLKMSSSPSTHVSPLSWFFSLPSFTFFIIAFYIYFGNIYFVFLKYHMLTYKHYWMYMILAFLLLVHKKNVAYNDKKNNNKIIHLS